MAIENRNLAPGTKLVARYKGATYRAEVVNTDEGKRYRLEDGREFKSPSTAGAAVMGPKRTCNGWAFWSLDDGSGEPPTKPKAEKAPPKGQIVTVCTKCEAVFENGDVEAHFAAEHPKAKADKNTRRVERVPDAGLSMPV